MSVTHRTLGAAGLKLRPTRSSATRMPGTRIVVRPRFFAISPGDRGLAHEPLNALAANANALGQAQLGMDPSRAIDAAIGGVNGFDALQQPGVAERAVAGRPAQPVIEARPRDAEQLAAHRDRGAGLLRRDKPVDAHRVSVSFAKKAAARLSRSRSIRSRWFSRSSSFRRARSSEPRPSRSPTSTSCCRFHLGSDSGATPISPAIVTIDLPLRRYSSTASRLNCGGYGRRPLLLPATMDILRPGPDGPSAQVSVKAGALQASSTRRFRQR